MATQDVKLAGFRQPPTTRKFVQEASYEERCSNLSVRSQLPTSQTQYQKVENNHNKPFQGGSKLEKGERQVESKLQRQRRGDEKRLLCGIGLRFLAFSVSYVLKKAKLLYRNRFSCDAFNNHPRMEIEASLVDAYFSIPVVSATIMTRHAV